MEEEVLRVRFLTGMAGRGFAYEPGQEVVLKRAEAHRLMQHQPPVCEPVLATGTEKQWTIGKTPAWYLSRFPTGPNAPLARELIDGAR